VIFNNGVLGFVVLEMKASGFIETASIGKSISRQWPGARCIHARRVEDPGDLPQAIR
jgi:pyruvate dehydrogenase (quinone)